MSTNNLQSAMQRADDTRNTTPAGNFHRFLEKHKDQLALALPKHLNADRMARLAMTAFSQSRQLQECDPKSIYAAVMLSSQLGLEIGVSGHAYIVPYGKTATFVPGWKGIVDLVSRTGRAGVWTGAVYRGDEFDYQLGDSPYIKHRPGGEDDPNLIEYVYAVGRVNKGEWPVIEVWPISRCKKHFKKMNKQGEKHYAHKNWEMYCRKLPLLQVCKYMPSSPELSAAVAADYANETGKGMTFDGEFVTVHEDQALDPGAQDSAGGGQGQDGGTATPSAAPAGATEKAAATGGPTYAELAARINKAASKDDLDQVLSDSSGLPEDQQKEIADAATSRLKKINKPASGMNVG